MPPFSQSYLKSILEYNPETGVFTWLVQRGPVGPGTVAGKNSIDSYGYRQIMVDGVGYLSGRLAWFYMTGEWPKELIDHKDNNQLNDRWENLREANDSTSAMNRRKRTGSRSKFIGVYRNGSNWTASICKEYKRKHLGTFETQELAAAAYDAAAKTMFGEYAKLKLPHQMEG